MDGVDSAARVEPSGATMDPHFDGVIFQPSAEEIARRLDRDSPPLAILDVRQLSSFVEGRLPGSVPTGDALASGAEVLVVGESGNDTRVRAASLDLLSHGRRVSELSGGIQAWKTLGLPLETGAFEAQPTGRDTAPAPQPDDTAAAARKKNTLFWDVDTQIDFMQPDGKLYVPEAESLTENLAALSRLADTHGIPVLASADDHEENDPEISDEPDFASTYPPHCMRGSEGARRVGATNRDWTAEIGHSELSAEELQQIAAAGRPQILVHKKQFDVFTNPNVEPLLEALDPGRIVVYGVALDVCNKAAVEGLLDRGFTNLTVVTDATKPIRKETEAELLASWRERGAKLATTAEVVDGSW